MGLEEVKEFYSKLEKYWGDQLTNFEHYPLRFAWQVKVFKFKKGIK